MQLSQPSILRSTYAVRTAARRVLLSSIDVQQRFSSTLHAQAAKVSESQGESERGNHVSAAGPGIKFRSLADVSANNPKEGSNTLLEADPYPVKILWKHPGYEKDQMKAIEVAHLQPASFQDRIALATLRVVRWGFDFATRYKHPREGQEDTAEFRPTADQWLQRFIFLESIAGVPGMVGGMVRHLQSLRLLRRDNAWMETLMEEAYNERMHLMSFMKIAHPGWFMRLCILGAQGIFFNCFFIAYLLFPRICHRFVGYLEEEAIVTYTRCIDEMEAGYLPEFSEAKAPDIAINYWKMTPGSTVKDMIYYVRADESKHREVNHTLGNLKQKTDPNPYALDFSKIPADVPRPTHDLKYSKQHPVGWKREDIKF